MKYIILEATTAKELQELVNAHLDKSFKLVGGLSVGGMSNAKRFYQAVAK